MSRASLQIINGEEVLSKHKGVIWITIGEKLFSLGDISITNKQISEEIPSSGVFATVKLCKDNRPFAQREAWSWLKRTVLLVFEQCGHEKREKSKLPPFTVF